LETAPRLMEWWASSADGAISKLTSPQIIVARCMVLKFIASTVIFLRIHGQIRVSDEKAAVLQKTFQT